MATTKVTTDVIDMSGNTGGLVWAKGATGDQPAVVDSTAGDLRENTTTGRTEVFNGTAWRNLKEIAPPPPLTVDFLVVAGGGSGGADGPGGGGAGGYLTTSTYGGTESSLSLSTGVNYTITVGLGGASQAVGTVVGNTGGDSIILGTGITTITVKGGGGGGSYGGSADATDGGSGGGGGYNNLGTPGTGGSGVGGAGSSTSNGVDGSSNTGGGGGGTSIVGGTSSGAGGSGIVILRCTKATATLGSGITVNGISAAGSVNGVSITGTSDYYYSATSGTGTITFS